MKLTDLLKNKKILVCVGTGGVGKTTISSVLGVLAAQQGRRVLVLTVDPAKRLATALGLENLKGADTSVALPGALTDALPGTTGEMFAAVVEPQAVFDSFVRDHTRTEEEGSRILNNRIYQKLSTALSGSQEFTALERFYRAYESNKYDLIILDTPPASHALDFLDSAAKLSALFHDSVVRWFIRPLETKGAGFFSNLISRGTNLAFKALERLTGSEFIKELIEFFLAIYSLRDALVKRLEDIQVALKSDKASFVLVTAYDQTKLKLAEGLHHTLEKRGYSLESVIINRSFPHMDVSQTTSPEESVLLDYYQKLSQFYKGHEAAVHQFRSSLSSNIEIRLIPDQDQDIFDVKGLTQLARVLL